MTSSCYEWEDVVIKSAEKWRLFNFSTENRFKLLCSNMGLGVGAY